MRAARELGGTTEIIRHLTDVLLVFTHDRAERLARIDARDIADPHRCARERGHDGVLQLFETAIARAGRLHGNRQFVTANLQQLTPHWSAYFTRDRAGQQRGVQTVARERRTIGFERDLIAALTTEVAAAADAYFAHPRDAFKARLEIVRHAPYALIRVAAHLNAEGGETRPAAAAREARAIAHHTHACAADQYGALREQLLQLQWDRRETTSAREQHRHLCRRTRTCRGAHLLHFWPPHHQPLELRHAAIERSGIGTARERQAHAKRRAPLAELTERRAWHLLHEAPGEHGQHRDGGNHGGSPPAQQPRQHARIGAPQRGPRHVLRRHAGAQRRHHQQRRKHTPPQGEHKRRRERHERGPRVALQIQKRKEHHGGGKRAADNGGHDTLRGARAAVGRIGLRPEPLDHDQAVLHENADAHAQSRQREQVGRNAEQVQRQCGGGDGDGRRAHHHRHRTPATQREGEHQQHTPERDRTAQGKIVELDFQIFALIGIDAQPHRRRHARLQLRDRGPQCRRRFDGIGAGMPRNLHRHGGRPINAKEAAAGVLFGAHRGQLAQSEHARTRATHRQRLQIFEGLRLIAQHHVLRGGVRGVAATFEYPQRLHHARAADRFRQSLRRDADAPQMHRIVRYRHAEVGAAAHLHTGHAGNAAKPRTHAFLEQLLQRARGVWPEHRERHERRFFQPLRDIVGHGGWTRPGRQIGAQQFEPLEDGQARHLHIGALLQLHREHGVVVVGVAGHTAHTTHALNGRFNRTREIRLNYFR